MLFFITLRVQLRRTEEKRALESDCAWRERWCEVVVFYEVEAGSS